MSLYTKHRPSSLDDLVGQPKVKKVLESFFQREEQDVPRVYLLQGASGAGKTTTARIIKDFFEVNEHCFLELDGANNNGVNDARRIVEGTSNMPMFGDKVAILIDECHRLSKEAWDIFLKPTEDVRDHVIFLFATTEQEKIKKTVKDRCQVLTFDPLEDKALGPLLQKICKKEEKVVAKTVLKAIVSKAEGSARKAINLLESIIDVEADDMMEIIESAITSEESDDLKALFLLLMNKGSWAKMAPILKKTKETPESIRFQAIKWMSSCLLNDDSRNDNKHLSDVIQMFSNSFEYNGKSALVGACYDCSSG